MMDAVGHAAEARAALAWAIEVLTVTDADTETLAELHVPRRIGPIRRSPKFTVVAKVWRLGVLLLAADTPGDADAARLFATGAVTRARDPRHPNFTSVSGEQRRELREAARKAGLASGETVNYDALPLPLDGTLGSTGPLVLRDGRLFVSWNGSRAPDSLTPFEAYLDKRVELLADPLQGA